MKKTAAVPFSLVLTFAALGGGCARLESRKRGPEPTQKREPRPIQEPSETVKGLRNVFLTLKPEHVGVTKKGAGVKVYGLMTESGCDVGLASVVATRDGGASLYLGHGGGILGGVGYENARTKAAAAAAEAEKHLPAMKKTDSFPHPALGRVKFYVLTFGGVLTAEADEDELKSRRHKLSPLFYAGHEVLTQLFIADGRLLDGRPEVK